MGTRTQTLHSAQSQTYTNASATGYLLVRRLRLVATSFPQEPDGVCSPRGWLLLDPGRGGRQRAAGAVALRPHPRGRGLAGARSQSLSLVHAKCANPGICVDLFLKRDRLFVRSTPRQTRCPVVRFLIQCVL